MKKLHYSWVMVFLSSFILAVISTRFSTFGVFLLPLTGEFKWERGALSVAITISAVVGGLLAIVAGRLSDRYGPRLLVTINGILTAAGFLLLTQVKELWHVYLIWGVLFGAGSAFSYIPLMSTVTRWFNSKRSTAIGITLAGFGIGAIIWPPITQLFITSFQWRWACVILGLINLVFVIPLAQFLKNKPQDVGLLPYGEKILRADEKRSGVVPSGGLTLGEAVRTSRFWLIGLILFCFYAGHNVMYVHIVAHAQDIGIPPLIAAGTLSFISGSSIISRLTIGLISDKIGPRKALVIGITLAVIALGLLSISRIWSFYAFTIIFGLAYGSMVPLETAVPATLFGTRSLGMIMAIMGLVSTLGFAVSPPIAGAIYDATQKYQSAFLMCLALAIVGLILSIILLRLKDKPKLS
ncbi:MAG: MFS transporter [Dehalococcoidales bacterium]|nr:MFS transporter [Dehalococcoidales bacterium]